jgi:redox-sensitive bicupin YhaK (pirin superfamily)
MEHRLAKDRRAWPQIIGGALECRGTSLQGGDGAAVSDEDSLVLVGEKKTEFLLFDLN